uniref:Doublecortin domain containing 1 n=1 Tax=Leptobrachium leishanense TaxID=445787 RepID=A0A8C5WGR1_9ANUR
MRCLHLHSLPSVLSMTDHSRLSSPSTGNASCRSLISDTSFPSTSRSQTSSLEGIIVQEYLDAFESPSRTTQTLPQKYKSPYAKSSTRCRKGRLRDKSPHLSPASSLLSVLVSRAASEEYSLQTTFAQKRNGVSDLDLNNSDIADNPSLSSSSNKNSHVSAPPGHLRNSVKKSQRRSDYFATPIFKRQPYVIRAFAFKNGTNTMSVKVSAPTIRLLLERCTVKLKLNMAARRVFLADGTEALEPKDLPHDTDVYISTGEPFIDPFKYVKENEVLASKVTWTMNGLVLPTDEKRGKTKPLLSKRIKDLMGDARVRILVFVNGNGHNGQEIVAVVDQVEMFLDLCTSKLNLGSSAKGIFDCNGEKIEDLKNVPLLDKCLQNSITPLRGPVWVTKGEGFSPSGVKIYIQGVLTALCQRLKSARSYDGQLQHFMNGLTNEVTRKEIFSMTEEELYTAHAEVNELIDKLKTAIKNHRGQLSKLASQLQAEQEQCAAYIYQHVKELPASAVVPKGLHLKVYENGKDSGGTLLFISKKGMQNNPTHHSIDTVQEFLQTILERIQHSVDFNHAGLRPSRLFDEKGMDIKNPQSLQDEQKVWFSYGEAFRPPTENVLNLIFDKVIYVEEDGKRMISKTFMDPDDLLPGCGSWHISARFPDNVTPTCLPSRNHPEAIVADSLFLQLKVDHQVILYPSVIMEKRSRTSVPKGKNEPETKPHGKNESLDPQSGSTLQPCNVWLITKGGMILSRVMPQVCLAVGSPIKLNIRDGPQLQGYQLSLQKREKDNPSQLWRFGTNGTIYSKAYPEFVLTYLEELNVKEVVSQAADHMQEEPQPLSPQDTGTISSHEALQNDASHLNPQQVSQLLAAQLSPTGGPGEERHLTVALVRKFTEKHPQAPAQRWAIKHEGTSKPGQWKKSKVDNPLWNKLTLMWPVLPSGEINEDFAWPIQGSLISNSPPLKKPCSDLADSYTPKRLKVLKNGDWETSRACFIVGPNVSNMLRKHNSSPYAKTPGKPLGSKTKLEDHSEKVYQIEFEQFLERCTWMMDLPSAARRLFNENGAEIFRLRGVERDQMVYVSCGDQWIDPKQSSAEHKKHVLHNNLASDVSLIRNYCCLRNPENLVLEVRGPIAAGANLTINFMASLAYEEETVRISEETKDVVLEDSDDFIDSHTRTHRRVDAMYTDIKYAWQHASKHDEGENNTMAAEYPANNLHNSGPSRKIVKVQQIHRQQFEFLEGQIINSVFPWLVLGVGDNEVHAGVDVLLIERRPDDMLQHWEYSEQSRTFHLASCTELVLAVSMPKTYPGIKATEIKFPGCNLVLQKYKDHVNGAANQKWCYIPSMRVLGAFHSDQLDKEITAANQASVCSFTVSNAVTLSQPGYSLTSLDDKERTLICSACARNMRGHREVTKTPAGTMFFCASGHKDPKLSPLGPFKCLHVEKTDLSTSEAQNTLTYFEEMLSSMTSSRSTQIVAHKVSKNGNQRTLKIMAYKNGSGLKNGRMIVAGSFPMLLSMCTKELELPRPATRLYTSDGTVVHMWESLMVWAVNDFFKQNEEQIESETSTSDIQGTEGENEKSKLTLISPEDLNIIDDSLLSFILRNPIDVWVSCGEPFRSSHALQRSQKQDKLHWLQKEKILTDLNGMKHKMRHLQGRRVKFFTSPSMTHTKNPAQPVLVRGGWTEETNEETKLMKNIHNKQKHLSEIQAMHVKKQSVTETAQDAGQKALYNCPTMKRVLVYLNGGDPERAIFAWGKTLEELLENCTSRLNMQLQSAAALYTPDGNKVTSWRDLEKDMLLCVSSGEKFLSKAASQHMIQVKANYARIRRKYGPEATDVIIASPKMTDSQGSVCQRAADTGEEGNELTFQKWLT